MKTTQGLLVNEATIDIETWMREMEDENGVPVVDYVDTEYMQFAIAVGDDGHIERGHILGRLSIYLHYLPA